MYSQNGEKGSLCYSGWIRCQQSGEATRAWRCASDKDFNVAFFVFFFPSEADTDATKGNKRGKNQMVGKVEYLPHALMTWSPLWELGFCDCARENIVCFCAGVFSEISSSSWNIMAYKMLQNNIFGFPAFIFSSKLYHSSCTRYKDSQFCTNSNCL